MRPPVLIVGSHRSGTSAVTRALRLLGWFGGIDLEEHDEPRFVMRLHDRYLAEHGATWFAPWPFLERIGTAEGLAACAAYLRRETGRRLGPNTTLLRRYAGWFAGTLLAAGYPLCWGWKDPRTTLFGPAWLEVFPGAAVVHVVRHPLDTALSLRAREVGWRREGHPEKAGMDDLACCVRLVDAYVTSGLALAQRTTRYREVRFEDLQQEPARVLGELALHCGLRAGGGALERAARTIDTDRTGRWSALPPAERARLMQLCAHAGRFRYEA